MITKDKNYLGSELIFLGTGAADWLGPYPSDEFRGYASALVDGHILIDCGSAALEKMKQLEIDWSTVSDVIITHSHDDHFGIESIQRLAMARNHMASDQGYQGPLTVHVEESWASQIASKNFIVNPLEVGKEVQVGGCKILPPCLQSYGRL